MVISTTIGRRLLAGFAVAGLLTVLLIQLVLSVRQESQTWDEGNHIFAGYRSWTHADFGLSPEHPPLVKLLATTPLLTLPFARAEITEPEQALIEVRWAVSIAPDAVRPMIALGDALATLGKLDEASAVYERALAQVRALHPEFQWRQIEELERRLGRR